MGLVLTCFLFYLKNIFYNFFFLKKLNTFIKSGLCLFSISTKRSDLFLSIVFFRPFSNLIQILNINFYKINLISFDYRVTSKDFNNFFFEFLCLTRNEDSGSLFFAI